MLSSLLIFQLYQQIIVRIELQCGSGGGFGWPSVAIIEGKLHTSPPSCANLRPIPYLQEQSYFIVENLLYV